jgi:hypothetical protein
MKDYSHDHAKSRLPSHLNWRASDHEFSVGLVQKLTLNSVRTVHSSAHYFSSLIAVSSISSPSSMAAGGLDQEELDHHLVGKLADNLTICSGKLK